MNNNDWSNLGEQVKSIVQDAIDSQDFTKLNQTIRTTIDNTINHVGNSFQNSTKSTGPYYHKQPYTTPPRPVRQPQPAAYLDSRNPLFARTTGTLVGGIFMTAFGGIFSTVIGINLLVWILIAIFRSSKALPPVALGAMAAFFLLTAFLTSRGISLLTSTSRFSKYVRELRGKTYANVKDLASHIRKSPKFVQKDLRRMISRNWFREGHLDDTGQCLIVSNQTYQEYKQTQAQAREQEQKAQELQQVRGTLSPEAQQVLKTGNDYILKIRQGNDAIPGIEISEKITQVEVLIQKIFTRAEQHPEIVPDLSKMIDYYLPTTIKLLDAYQDLDAQPVQGPNIINAKKEIESTLDTLIIAFEKLLDNLFRDVAWDVSSDISVLNTMLAQEGLTGNDFK